MGKGFSGPVSLQGTQMERVETAVPVSPASGAVSSLGRMLKQEEKGRSRWVSMGKPRDHP